MPEPEFAPADGVAPRRSQFATTDPDEAQEFIDQMYSARPPKVGNLSLSAPVAISQVSAGGLSYVDFTMPPDVTLHLDGTDDLSVTTLIAGGTHAELGKDTERYTRGDAFLGSFPRGDYLVRCVDFRAGILTVPAAALARSVAALPDRNPAPLRFDSLAPSSPRAAAQWKRAAAFAREVLDDDQTAASPLVLGSTARLLAATALAVFPNNLLPEHGVTGDQRATPDTVRRAEEFIHAHAHTDIDLTDLAATCHVTPRALQYAFARHHDMSPMQYLRRVRLFRAHQDLLDADPTSGTTVTTVAARWGFAHPGRFATAYRRTFGEPPSSTLRS
ncbi:helix-turn-helix transcriptional regulator [Actinomycetospora flava]|uniref:Helix-turn-helix transcriptional regulator n=1 Tax=Actinomycetospora flava TaxID=3129232 RepID=A0ABU8MAD5_9PSEU